MKFLQEKIKKVFIRAKHFFVHVTYEKSGVYPQHDWKIIVITFVITVVLGGMYALYIDIHIQDGSFWNTVSNDQSVPLQKINQMNVTTVRTYFDQKEKNLNDALTGSKRVPDPSL